MQLEKLNVKITATDTGLDKALKNLDTRLALTSRSVSMLNASTMRLFRSMATAAFSAAGVASLTTFSAKCIELGSNLAEVQNVVDTTFPTMSDQIQAWSENALEAFGLSETMAKNYASTLGTMAQSMGFTERQAYQMGTTLTELTGDVASFYNLSAEEAYSKLKGVFTGETEGLKSLGVVMTQTTLDEYALAQGIGKTTSQMTSSEKVALRYRYALNALSKASGDFAKTSDGWANQMRVLQLRWQSIQATLGQGLINALTPALKLLNQFLATVEVIAAKFTAVTSLIFGTSEAGGTQAAVTVTDAIADNLTTAQAAAEATKKALAGFHELNVISSGSASSGDAGGATGAAIDLGDALTQAGTAKAAVEITEKMERLAESCRRFLDAVKPIVGAVGQGFLSFWTDLFGKFFGGKDAIEVLNSISEWLEGIDPAKAEKFGRTLGGIVSDLLILAGIGVISPEISFSIAAGWSIGQLINEALGEDPVSMTDLGVEIGTELMDGTFSDTVFGFAEDSWRSFWDSIWQSLQDHTLFQEGAGFIMQVLPDTEFFNWCRDVQMATSKLADEELNLLLKVNAAIRKFWWDLAFKVKDGLVWVKNKFIDFKTKIEEVAADIREAFEDGFDVNELIGFFRESFRSAANAAIGVINSMISAINRKLSFSIPGGSFLGQSWEATSVSLANIPTIPALATGGITAGSTLARIGEAGREAVLPLDRNTGWMDQLAERLNTSANVQVEITGDMGKLFRAVQKEAQGYSARTGRPAFNN